MIKINSSIAFVVRNFMWCVSDLIDMIKIASHRDNDRSISNFKK